MLNPKSWRFGSDDFRISIRCFSGEPAFSFQGCTCKILGLLICSSTRFEAFWEIFGGSSFHWGKNALPFNSPFIKPASGSISAAFSVGRPAALTGHAPALVAVDFVRSTSPSIVVNIQLITLQYIRILPTALKPNKNQT